MAKTEESAANTAVTTVVEKTQEALAALAPKAEAAKASATDAAGQAKEWAAPKLADALDQASDALKQAGDKVSDVSSSVGESVQGAAESVRESTADEPAHRRWPKLLVLGTIAAIGAVGARIFMSRRRKDDWETVEEWEPPITTTDPDLIDISEAKRANASAAEDATG